MKITVDAEEAKEQWKKGVPKLKAHIHRKRKQIVALESDKWNLMRGEVIIHRDFSQSYKNSEQDEIQSAYFGHECFSLFTASVYYKNDNDEIKVMPVTVTTEGSEHSRQTSFSCLKKIIEHVEEKLLISIRRVILWSDGCSAQFRSRFVSLFLAHFMPNLDIELQRSTPW